METPEEFAFDRGVINEETSKIAKLKLGEAYEEILSVIEYYMDMPEDQIKMVAIWIIGTYFHSSFSSYPFLFINAMRGSGKTRLLNIIAHLSKGSEGQVQVGITEAVLFRMAKGDTLVLDEIESIGGKDKAVLREYLNTCYKVGATVKRLKKTKVHGEEKWVSEGFEPYKPIAMANIWGMEEVLNDRCVSLVLEKSNNPLKTKLIEDFHTNPRFKDLNELLTKASVVSAMSLQKRNEIKAWNDFIKASLCIHILHNNNMTLTQSIDNKKNDSLIEDFDRHEMFVKINELGISGRNLELLFPMLIIAKLLSYDTFDDILRIGREMMEVKKSDELMESRDAMVYEFVANKPSELTFIAVKILTHEFRVWTGTEEDWVNPRWFGKALKRLNLVLDSNRQASGRFVMLNVVKAKEKLKIFQ